MSLMIFDDLPVGSYFEFLGGGYEGYVCRKVDSEHFTARNSRYRMTTDLHLTRIHIVGAIDNA